MNCFYTSFGRGFYTNFVDSLLFMIIYDQCLNSIKFIPIQHQLTDVMFAELPRVRLDGAHRTNKFLFDAHPTLCEVPEECEGYLDASNTEDFDQQDFQQRLELNTTLISPLGE